MAIKANRARNAQSMYKRMEQVHRDICNISPESGAYFRECIHAVLKNAPRNKPANSKHGFFEAETIKDILNEARRILSARGLDTHMLDEA